MILSQISFFQKLEDQEKRYIAMLEKIQCEVNVSTSNSNSSSVHNQRQHCQTTALSRTITNTSSSSHNHKKIIEEQMSRMKNTSVIPSLQSDGTCISRSSAQQPLFTTQSELYSEEREELPVNSLYYQRLHLPPPKSFPKLSKNVTDHNNTSELIRDDNLHKTVSDSYAVKDCMQLKQKFTKPLKSLNNLKVNKKICSYADNDFEICDESENTISNATSSCDSEKVNYPLSRKRKLLDPNNVMFL